MIESLVTIVIVSFGLLGIVGLLVTGISSSNMSQMRTTAVLLANELAERMRANQSGVTASSGGQAYLSAGSNSKVCKPDLSNTLPMPCSPTEMAAYDIYEWKDKISKALPNGEGTITRNVGTALSFEIQINWLEDKKSNSSMNFKLRFEP